MSNNVEDLLGIHLPQFTHALCREFDADLFFPHKGGSARQAKLICSYCTHSDPCRAEARERGERFGVFGGEDADERSAFIATGEEPRYSPVRDLHEMGLPINVIAKRCGIQHDSVTANLRRKKAGA